MLESKKYVLVAGGAGFIGSHLVESLIADGCFVDVYDNFVTGSPTNLKPNKNNLFVFREDIVNLRDQSLYGAYDVIYNLACPASPKAYQANPVDTLLTSVMGTRNLLELAKVHGARFVQASTSEVYGDPLEHPQRETYYGNVNTWGDRACYDEGKRCAETLCYEYRRLGVDVRVARIFNTYGERMTPNDGRIVSTLTRQAIQRQPLTVYGDGQQTRSFCYVSDMVRGLRSLADIASWEHGPVNLGNSMEYKVIEVVEMLSEWFPKLLVVNEDLPQDDPKVRKPDLTLAKRELGYEPTVQFRTGLVRTIEWMQSQLTV